MRHVWACFAKGDNIVFDESLGAISKSEVGEFEHLNAREGPQPTEVPLVQLEVLQGALIHLEGVSHVHIRHVVQKVHFLNIRDHRHQLYHVYLTRLRVGPKAD